MARIAIIGGGISGLSLAYFLHKNNPSEEITVLESEKRPGGKIWTDKVDGFLCEWGVNGFLDNRPKTLALARNMSLEPLRSNEASRKRFIFSGGGLQRLPETPPAFLTSGLLSLIGRLRVMAELFIPGNAQKEETLAAFARRRLGTEAYEKLIDPMASGIYAGDPETLSLRACFPKVYDLEVNYGGLIRGMLQLQKARKKEGSREKVGPGPGGVLTSFHSGMEELIYALRAELGERIRINHNAVSIIKKDDGYDIAFSDGTRISAEIAVLAVPAYASAKILKSLDPALSGIVAGIPYPSLSVVCFGYKKDKVKSALDGFGYLIPSREKRKILGTLWDSSIFPDRAPEGFVLLRSMVGGARASETARLDDSELTDVVQKELADIMDISARPDLVRIYRHEKAIPQYTTGHRDKLNQIDNILLQYQNLYITGNAFRGIGVNDCIENSFKLSERISGKVTPEL
jgi:oxygen-dependent protoporphyrinogen oxidase